MRKIYVTACLFMTLLIFGKTCTYGCSPFPNFYLTATYTIGRDEECLTLSIPRHTKVKYVLVMGAGEKATVIDRGECDESELDC
ncbi:MAG: hypothetical protein PSV16_12735 [Flavobacterium sp.]|nr:hypothetical protein [Flavobacterium sp.]